MANIVCLAMHPLVFAVLRRTVAKVDSMGLDVRICCQCMEGKGGFNSEVQQLAAVLYSSLLSRRIPHAANDIPILFAVDG